jgi:DNA-binding NarL/FixJ family response regulator
MTLAMSLRGVVMRRLVFIDDDETELKTFHNIVANSYMYETVHWPRESAKLFAGSSPDIFVSDLYLPSVDGDRTPTDADKQKAAREAKEVGNSFLDLYADTAIDAKARLQKTMRAIADAYDMLKLQWSALGQSPDHGVALLAEVKTKHPQVPFVFYSRKITPEDVIRVLKAGATDAIRKGALEDEEVLARLEIAQEMYKRGDIQATREKGLNINSTLIPG